MNPPAGEDFGAARRGTGAAGPPTRQLVLFADRTARWDQFRKGDPMTPRRMRSRSGGAIARPTVGRSSKLRRRRHQRCVELPGPRGLGRADHQRLAATSAPRARRCTTTSTASTTAAHGAHAVIDDICRCSARWAGAAPGDDAVAMASAYRSYAHHHPAVLGVHPHARWAVTTTGVHRRLACRRRRPVIGCWPPTAWTATTPSTRPLGSGRRCTAAC